MTLPSSGQLSLNQIHIEAGGTSGTQVTLNDSDVRGLISKADNSQNKISEYYGASSAPAHTDDFSTQVGIDGSNTFYYMSNPSTNLYTWNGTSPTVTMRYNFNQTVSPATYSTFTTAGANGGAQSAASIADSSGHVHDHVAYAYDGGDGYAPGVSFFYWEAQSGGRLLGNGTANNWGELECYSPLNDVNTSPLTGAPNGSLNNNDGYIDVSADSGGNENIVNTPDGIPYGINSDISMLYGWLGSLGGTIYFHADFT